jgi:hypothetical protein
VYVCSGASIPALANCSLLPCRERAWKARNREIKLNKAKLRSLSAASSLPNQLSSDYKNESIGCPIPTRAFALSLSLSVSLARVFNVRSSKQERYFSPPSSRTEYTRLVGVRLWSISHGD